MVFVLIGLKILTWTRQSQEFKSACQWSPLLIVHSLDAPETVTPLCHQLIL